MLAWIFAHLVPMMEEYPVASHPNVTVLNVTSKEAEPTVYPEAQIFTTTELKDIAKWVAARAWNESKTPMCLHNERMAGRATDIMVVYLITGIDQQYPLHRLDELVPVMNFYNIAPKWIQERIEPIIERWRSTVYKDPDYIKNNASCGI